MQAEEIVAGMPTRFVLPAGAVVVSTWQGYMFEYVLVQDGDNPPVWVFIEGEDEPAPRRGGQVLSTWLSEVRAIG